MPQIICPQCKTGFTIDETGYEEIVRQVRNDQFESELKSREELIRAQNEAKQLSRENDFTIQLNELKNKLIEADVVKKNEIDELVHTKNRELELLKEELASVKEFKAKKNVKILGEDLEKHCQNEFEKYRQIGFSKATFEKDSTISDGTKGDYIFRDFTEHGHEYVSIMFEMKNESDESSNKKKNEDFLEKLDKDRKAKNCEYAVLVSVLEADNEAYNSGIVDKSHRYPKMYVVRPEFFITIITILRNASQSVIALKNELEIKKAADIELTNFEGALNSFKDKFNRDRELAGNQYSEAIKNIDAAIRKLEDTKEALRLSAGHLDNAVKKLNDVTVKKLTKDSPSIAAKLAQIQIENDGVQN